MKRVLLILMAFCFLGATKSFGQVDISDDSEPEEEMAEENIDELFELSLEELMNIEVSTTSRGGDEGASKAPATVFVITSEMIIDRGYQSLLDVMYDLPEFKVDFGVDPRWMNDITMRGIRYMTNFIILQDGIRINSPTNDFMPIMENYPVHHLKQIEIVYGPASALYGADAFSGVINMITKSADDMKNGNVQVGITGGRFGYFNTNVVAAKKITDNIEFMVAGQLHRDQQADFWNFYEDEYTIPIAADSAFGAFPYPNQDRVTAEELHEEGRFPTGLNTNEDGLITDLTDPNQKIDPNLVMPIRNHAITAVLKVHDFEFSYFHNYARNPSSQAQTPNNTVINADNFFGHQINTGNIKYTKDLIPDKLRSQSFVTYSRYDLDPRSNFRNLFTGLEPGYLYASGWMFKVEEIMDWKINDKISAIGGATYERFRSVPRSNNLEFPADPNNLDEAIQLNTTGGQFAAQGFPDGIPANLFELYYTNIGGFLQAQYSPIQNLTFTAGSRLDVRTRYFRQDFDDPYVTINPRAGIVYQPTPKITLKALFGTAFLAPSPQLAFDRYGDVLNIPPVFPDSTFGTGGNGAFFRQLPNPDLEPQVVRTTEVSARALLNDNFSLTLTGYFNNINNLIFPSSDPEDLNELYPGNQSGPNNKFEETEEAVPYVFFGGQVNANNGEQQVFGGTFQVDGFTKFAGDLGRVNGTFTYSFTAGTFDPDGDGPIETINLGSISTHVLKLGGSVKYGKFNLSPQLSWYSDQRTFNPASVRANEPTEFQEIDGFFLLNAKLAFQAAQGVSLYGMVRNLTDVRFKNVSIGTAPENAGAGSAAAEFPGGVPQSPIRWMFGATVNF